MTQMLNYLKDDPPPEERTVWILFQEIFIGTLIEPNSNSMIRPRTVHDLRGWFQLFARNRVPVHL